MVEQTRSDVEAHALGANAGGRRCMEHLVDGPDPDAVGPNRMCPMSIGRSVKRPNSPRVRYGGEHGGCKTTES